MGRPQDSLQEKLLRHISVSQTGCWEWTGPCYPDGYGRVCHGRRKYLRAHRVSFEVYNGQIPDAACVLHSCDNRRCVNPGHLHLGTRTDNSREAKERKRLRTPRRIPVEDVVEMISLRRAGWKLADLAMKFGCSKSHASALLSGKYRRDEVEAACNVQ